MFPPFITQINLSQNKPYFSQAHGTQARTKHKTNIDPALEELIITLRGYDPSIFF